MLIWVGIFAIAMGYFESAVVVYLRKLYYPEGFSFPLQWFDPDIALVELFRELGTMIMLFAVGWIAGRSLASRFAFFVYSFAIWDIFYYVFLKVIEGWPDSLMTWDLLFLIPVSWVGPVICPVILSLIMILFALLILNAEKGDKKVLIKAPEWWLMSLGSLIVIISFTREYTHFILSYFSFGQLFSPSMSEEVMETAIRFVPSHFDWWIFIVGTLMILSGIIRFGWRMRNNRLS